MRIATVKAESNHQLYIESDDGRTGYFDVTPYLKLEAFLPLANEDAFQQIVNGGYFIEWDCGADLSADTIEAHFTTINKHNM